MVVGLQCLAPREPEVHDSSTGAHASWDGVFGCERAWMDPGGGELDVQGVFLLNIGRSRVLTSLQVRGDELSR